MGNIKDLLASLENKYTKPVSMVQILEYKYSFVTEENEIEEYQFDEPEIMEFVLSNDAEENKLFLKRMMLGVDSLSEQLHISKEDSIFVKIIEDYKKQLGKISDKKLESGDKLADSICKCIKKTILKLIDIEDFGIAILKYLQRNGFRLDSFEGGHKLSDDDLCFLDENLLQAYKEKTDNPSDNYRVVEMIQPIIRIFYIDEDDDETYSHFIPGICKYFVWEVGR